PVAAWRVDFDHEKAVGREIRLYDVVDLPGGVSASSDFYVYGGRLDHGRRKLPVRPSPAHGDLARRGQRFDFYPLSTHRKVKRVRHPCENAGALAQALPLLFAGANGDLPGQHHKCKFLTGL